MNKLLVFLIAGMISTMYTFAQPCSSLPIIPCHPNVPSFNVNFLYSNLTYASPATLRYGDSNFPCETCADANVLSPDNEKCIQFVITVDETIDSLTFWLPPASGVTLMELDLMDTTTNTFTTFTNGIAIDSARTYFFSYCAPGNNLYPYYIEAFTKTATTKDTIDWCGSTCSIPLNACDTNYNKYIWSYSGAGLVIDTDSCQTGYCASVSDSLNGNVDLVCYKYDTLQCDSCVLAIDYIHIKFSQTYTIDTHAVCDSLVWIDGNTYATSNNTATYTLTNSQGCDSLISLNLTIFNSSVFNQTLSGCDSLLVLGNYYYNSQVIYDTLSGLNSQACDSIVVTDLIINTSTSTIIDTVLNQGQTITVGTNTYDSEGVYMDTLLSSENCDSIIITTVSVLNGVFDKYENVFTVYPNPFNETITIRGIIPTLVAGSVHTDVTISKQSQLKIYNLLGDEVHSQKILEQVREHGIIIDVSQLPSGTYILEVSLLRGDAEGRGVRTKIVKQ